MNREKQLAKNTIIYMIGNISSKILGFLMLPIYTYYLSKTDLGSFDLILNTVTIIIPIITLSSISSIFRFVLESSDSKRINIVLSNGVLIILIGILASIIPYTIAVTALNISNAVLIILLVITTIMNNVWQQISRALHENLVFAVSGVIVTMAMFLTSIVLIVVLDMRLIALLLSYILSSLIAFVYIEWKIKIINRISFNSISINEIKSMIRYSLPLLPNDINWWIMTGANRYIISIFLGVDANGIFAVASKFPSLQTMINSIFHLAWTESAIKEYTSEDKDQFYTNMFNIFLRIQFTLFLVLLPVIKYLMRYIVNTTFLSAWVYVPFLMLGTVFSAFALFYGTGYLSTKDTKGAFTTTIFAAVINVLINLFFVKLAGLQSAAIANCVSFLCMWLLRVFHMRKYFKIKIDRKVLNFYLLLSICYIAGYYQNIIWIDITMVVVAFTTGYLTNRALVKKIIQVIKEKAFLQKKQYSLKNNI